MEPPPPSVFVCEQGCPLARPVCDTHLLPKGHVNTRLGKWWVCSSLPSLLMQPLPSFFQHSPAFIWKYDTKWGTTSPLSSSIDNPPFRMGAHLPLCPLSCDLADMFGLSALTKPGSCLMKIFSVSVLFRYVLLTSIWYTSQLWWDVNASRTHSVENFATGMNVLM